MEPKLETTSWSQTYYEGYRTLLFTPICWCFWDGKALVWGEEQVLFCRPAEVEHMIQLWCDSPTGFQFGTDWSSRRYLCVQVPVLFSSSVPRRLLQGDVCQYWSVPSAISQFASMDKHILQWQEFCRLWTIYVEQSTCSAVINLCFRWDF